MKIKPIELVIYILIPVFIIYWGIQLITPISQELSTNKQAKTEKESTVSQLKAKAESVQASKEQMKKNSEILKPFFKPEFQSSDSIAAFGGMFEDIVDYVRINQLLLRSIKYNINPAQDQIFANFANKYNVCEIQLYLVGTYPQLKKFIDEVFDYPYFLSISSIEINPYESNKKYLLARISINLYSSK